MKKKTLKSLTLNKKLVSNFKTTTVIGGTGQSVDQTCTGMATCTFDSAECTTAGNYTCYRNCNQQ